MNIRFSGDSAYFLDLYGRYLRDRTSVPADWALHFEEMEFGRRSNSGHELLSQLHDAYRRFGHVEAQLDPLRPNEERDPVLERLRSALSDGAAADPIAIRLGGVEFRSSSAEAAERLRSIYAGAAALEAEHLHDEEERDWWRQNFEAAFCSPTDEAILLASLESAALADEFESFMRVKFPTKKRFGVEGAESAIVFLRELLRAAPGTGIGEVVMGGMHRGRLATLAVALGKSPATLAAELMGRDLSEGAIYTGDVPYHLGYVSETSEGGNALKLTLLPHPSHLLVVAPVALGLARATAERLADGNDVLCTLLHTDAAFSGQGVSAELLQIGGLDGYTAGGAIHLVVNNQIGFTTLPSEGRSARYCTDFAKAVGLPVLHVNGEDPVAVARIARLALDWKRTFRRDVVIDLVCFRRHGHNELDEPRFTQPQMWKLIDGRQTVREKLAASPAVTPDILERANRAAADFRQRLQDGFEIAAESVPNDEPVQREAWSALDPVIEEDLLAHVPTGVSLERLREIGLAASTIPEDMTIHAKVRQFYDARRAAIESGANITFATAEALAFATLLAEGTQIRLSGQDAVRGTFTQRHLALHDITDGRRFMPLSRLATNANAFQAINSPLSEYGVLGFEYGHSLIDPNQLTLWEAQFGDFMNGAQVVIDQYIVSAEAKWRLKSGLVVLLPHGLEGQGPDHSSARIERLAGLCAGGNMLLANPSTPANLFHLLRRQIRAPWRKPLFVISPKSLLRTKAAVSALSDMGAGTAFRTVIADPTASLDRVKRVILCSGKVYYALDAERRKAGLEQTVALVRIEQLYPFPADALRDALAPFKRAELTWFQEEGENQGPWPHIEKQLARAGLKLSPALPLVSRPAMSVCAGGSIERHEREEKELLEKALQLN